MPADTGEPTVPLYHKWLTEADAAATLGIERGALRRQAVGNQGESTNALVIFVSRGKEKYEKVGTNKAINERLRVEPRLYYLRSLEQMSDPVRLKAREFVRFTMLIDVMEKDATCLERMRSRPRAELQFEGNPTVSEAFVSLEEYLGQELDEISESAFVKAIDKLKEDGALWPLEPLEVVVEGKVEGKVDGAPEDEGKDEGKEDAEGEGMDEEMQGVSPELQRIAPITKFVENYEEPTRSSLRGADTSDHEVFGILDGCIPYAVIALVELILYSLILHNLGVPQFLARNERALQYILPELFEACIDRVAALLELKGAVLSKQTLWERVVKAGSHCLQSLPHFPPKSKTPVTETLTNGQLRRMKNVFSASATPSGSEQSRKRPRSSILGKLKKRTERFPAAFKFWFQQLHSIIGSAGLEKFPQIIAFCWMMLSVFFPSITMSRIFQYLPSPSSLNRFIRTMGDVVRVRQAAMVAQASMDKIAVIYLSLDAGHTGKKDMAPVVAFWYDFVLNRPRYQPIELGELGKAGKDAAEFVKFAFQCLLTMQIFALLTVVMGGSMTDGASNMVGTMGTLLKAEYGKQFVVGNCAMHVMSLLLSVPYLFVYVECSNEVPSPLSLTKNLSWIFHDTLSRKMWVLLINTVFFDRPAIAASLINSIADVVLLSRWWTFPEALECVIEHWDHLIELLAIVEQGSITSGGTAKVERTVAGRLWEWMVHYKWLKVQCLFLLGFHTGFHRRNFAYVQAGDDKVTKMAGFRAHRMARLFLCMITDLMNLQTETQRRANECWEAYYTARDVLEDDEQAQLEQQADAFMKKALVLCQKHAKPWLTDLLHMALGDDEEFRILVIPVVLECLKVIDVAQTQEEAATLATLAGELADARTALANAGAIRKVREAPKAGIVSVSFSRGSILKAAIRKAEKAHSEEMDRQNARIMSTKQASLKERLELLVPPMEGETANFDGGGDTLWSLSDLTETLVMFVSPMLSFDWPISAEIQALLEKLDRDENLNAAEELQLLNFLKQRVYCYPHHTQMVERLVKMTRRILHGRPQLADKQAANRMRSQAISNERMYNIACSEEHVARVLQANGSVSRGRAGHRTFKKAARNEAHGKIRRVAPRRFRASKDQMWQLLLELADEVTSEEEIREATAAIKAMEAKVEPVLGKQRTEVLRVEAAVAAMLEQARKVKAGEGGARGKIERLTGSAEYLAKPLVNIAVRGIEKIGRIKKGSVIVRELELRGLEVPESYAAQVAALNEWANRGDKGGDGVGCGFLKLLSAQDDDSADLLDTEDGEPDGGAAVAPATPATPAEAAHGSGEGAGAFRTPAAPGFAS